MRYWVAIILGCLFGYAVLIVFANLESTAFVGIRSWITGKDALSEIVHHPADKWINLGLHVLFVLGGGAIGFAFAFGAGKSNKSENEITKQEVT